MSKIMLSSAIASALIALLLFANATHAQDATTLPVVVDGITRTLTIVVSGTGVLSATVAPITDTFKATATNWLDGLAETYNPAWRGDSINITDTAEALDELFAATNEIAYPAYWTPFVRQYRFAIHTCRRWLSSHNEFIDVPLMAGPWFTLSAACYEQYQDAYVEMERIAHPLPLVQNNRNK
ncbi:MAG: hypothetical protein ACOYNY_15730 [Caldilineaceae bacterium]|jgi:hypothetical protein